MYGLKLNIKKAECLTTGVDESGSINALAYTQSGFQVMDIITSA